MPPNKTSSSIAVFFPILTSVLWAFLFTGCQPDGGKTIEGKVSKNGQRIHRTTPSRICLDCHEDQHMNWRNSDHANANRVFDGKDWEAAFSPTQYYTLDGEISKFFKDGEKAVIQTVGPKGKIHDYTPEMVLAHRPLVQFLIPFEGGRWQTTELAWDVNSEDWFNVYGDEHRRPEEWGHWSRRGMNWNAQCAVCHTSYYEKNYRVDSDSYESKWKEMGISCQQCHGEMPQHLAFPDEAILEDEMVTQDAYLESCYSCHSRREDLTGNFRIGDRFSDHHRLQFPNQERLYFPDGQIKDEVFVYGSFLMSKMYHQGVRCLDCHDPHSLELKLPFENNALCMRCHQSPGLDNATPIDPENHSHHKADSMGNRCVECHMPERYYMQRDPRRDHGFHTPDPVLAKELAVPNACMNCHANEGEGEEWVETAFEQWYGDSENLEEKRHHARVVQKGYDRDPSVKNDMLSLLADEISPVWRAAFAQMILEMEPTEDDYRKVTTLLNDESSIVRGAIVQALGNYPNMEGVMKDALGDDTRLVRLDAAWYLRDQLEGESKLNQDLLHYIDYTSDQPGGALRKAHYFSGKGQKELALEWMDKVVKWDATSPDAWISRGMMQNRFGETTDAIKSFEKAHELTPDSVIPLSYQAMLIGEEGDLESTRSAWERVLKLDSSYGRAWYNLGLLLARSGNLDGAIAYLDQGIAVAPDDPDILYAKATLQYQSGAIDGAFDSLKSVLEDNPDYGPALEMIRMMRAPEKLN